MRASILTGCLLALTAIVMIAGCPPKAEVGPDPVPPASAETTMTETPDTDPATTDPTATAGDDAKTLFEVKCAKCHSLQIPQKRSETEAEWQEIVQEMSDKKAGWISAEDAATIVAYLVENHGK